MKLFTLLFSAVLIFTSCCIQGKMDAAKEVLSDFRKQQEIERQKIESLRGLSGIKLGEGKIDTTIQNRILKRLQRFQVSMNTPDGYANRIDSLLASKKTFRKNYETIVLPFLDSLQKSIGGYANRLKLYIMVEDGLDIAKYELFDLAAFFGPGKYEIPEEKSALAIKSFSPIIDSVIKFADKYNVPGTASLVILGFADGTGFSNSGPLFETLTGHIGRRDVTKEELNQKLSELRARELIKQLTIAFIQKKPSFAAMEKILVEYIGQGKGETYPLPTIRDYTVDDSRRRIVLCYWVVLPD